MNFEQGSGMQNFPFRVTIPDIGTIFCLAVSGIDSDVPIEYTASGQRKTPRLPGLRKGPDVTLKLCRTDNPEAITQWYLDIRSNSNIVRRDITVELINDVDNSAVACWNVSNAWPKALKGINNGSDGIDPYSYIETIILAHEGVTENPHRDI
ncbi:MAG: hypothetical protein BHV70_06760 [Bacteroidales bacterium 55_9]|nr:MAG: hypothetical protein BHV70_06760 [Bacteroidales bacterium 55_9]